MGTTSDGNQAMAGGALAAEAGMRAVVKRSYGPPEVLEAGERTPVIDRTYRLSAAAEALRYVGAGHTRGKVVVTV